MTTRLELAKAFVDECAQDYRVGDKNEDLRSQQNVVNYQNAVSQRKYVHMYFAKSVSCWREVRERTGFPNDGPVVSIGAGPCLCLLGWFWDVRPDPHQQIQAVDVLEWQAVRNLPGRTPLVNDVLGSGKCSYRSGCYFPDSAKPPQVERIPAQPLRVEDFTEDATVLVPFVLNHLVGRKRSLLNPALLHQWLEDLRARVQRVIIVDMHCSQAGQFWARLQAGLGIQGEARDLIARRIDELRDAYSTKGDWKNRRTSDYMRSFTAAVGDTDGWFFI